MLYNSSACLLDSSLKRGHQTRCSSFRCGSPASTVYTYVPRTRTLFTFFSAHALVHHSVVVHSLLTPKLLPTTYQYHDLVFRLSRHHDLVRLADLTKVTLRTSLQGKNRRNQAPTTTTTLLPTLKS